MTFALIDIEGLSLSPADQERIAHPAVFGVILFSRNYENPKQLRALTAAIRAVKPELCITVDQEGGRVQRFREQFTTLPSMRHWGEAYIKNPDHALQALRQSMTHLIQELLDVGVGSSLIPVLDLDYGVSEIIGERSFGRDPILVTRLAKESISVMHQHGFAATAKHFPGHGAVVLDSHEHLPIDSRSLEMLWDQDIYPYIHLKNHLQAVMPAHIIYSELDAFPAGFSGRWLQDILRRKIGFEGLIISDDLTMKATNRFGDYADRARLAKEAGCDVVTVCNNFTGVEAVLECLGDQQESSQRERVKRFKNLF